MGLMVFGFDYDDETVFEKTVNFMDEAKIDFPCYWILTPYPNTPLYNQLQSEGRIIERDWSRYDCSNVVFQPKLMSAETLKQGFHYAFNKSYSIPSMVKRLFPSSKKRIFTMIKEFSSLTTQLALFRKGAKKGYHPMMG